MAGRGRGAAGSWGAGATTVMIEGSGRDVDAPWDDPVSELWMLTGPPA
jgi:hypothetical protein